MSRLQATFHIDEKKGNMITKATLVEISVLDVDDDEREEIARQIKEGFTSGRIDGEDGRKCSWSLTTDVWEDK